jgi:hypothetical protein
MMSAGLTKPKREEKTNRPQKERTAQNYKQRERKTEKGKKK